MNEAREVGCFRSSLWLVGGMLGPLGCLVVELGTGMCREVLFDPFPTLWHVLLVLNVPVAMFLGVRALDRPGLRTRALGIMLGSAACTTLMYAVPFVPLLPISAYMIVVGIGLLGLAPFAAPIAVLSLAAEYRVRGSKPGERRLPGTWLGFFGCIAALVLIDIGPVRTVLGVRAAAQRPEDRALADWLREHADRGMLEELGGGRRSARPLVFLVRTNVPVDPEFVRVHWTRFTGEPLPEALQPQARD